MEGLRPLCAAGGNVKGAAHMEKNTAVLQNIKNRIIIWSSHSTYECVSAGIEIRIMERYLHDYVHCSIIHNNQDKKVENVHCQINGIHMQRNVIEP